MIFFFIITLFLSWLLVKLFWDEPAGTVVKYLNAAIAILAFFPMIKDEDVAILFLIIYIPLFVIINLIAFIIFAAIRISKADWNLIDVISKIEDYESSREDSGSSYSDREVGGQYVIQYRRHGSWIDGPGSNSEYQAESMFDQFLNNDPRAENRCRLVYKVNGRVKSILGSN